MASVWAARIQGTRGFEKLVAVKTILPHLADDPHFETMFLDEARIASEIVHPNIAQVFDLGDQDGVLYLVCEWIDGESLAMLRRRVEERGEQIPVPIALHIMADVCAGLHAAHELCDATGQALKVVHRDVSPQNIVISDAGAVKVIDFGVAKALNRALGETVAGGLKGKVQYMAPEQARNLSIDRRADLWSVGAVLYHLLTGRVPYEADSPLAVLSMLLSEEPPPPLPSHVPSAVAELVMRALKPDPADRFQSAAEMQVAIVMALRDVSMPVTDAVIADYVRKYLGAQAIQRHKVVSDALEAANQGPASHQDLTLVEYVTRVEEMATRADRGPPEMEQHEAVGVRHVMQLPPVHAPQIRQAPPAPVQPVEEPEPVPLVRRSKPDWTQSDPEIDRGLNELRSLVLHTLPESVIPPPMAPPEEPASEPAPTSASPNTKSSSKTIGFIVVVALLCIGAALAWPTWRRMLEARSTATSTPQQPSAAPSVVEPPEPPVIQSAPIPTVSVSAASVASSAPPAPAPEPPDAGRPPRSHPRPGSTVPLPPPGWESLPSVTLDPDTPENKDPEPGTPAPAPTKSK